MRAEGVEAADIREKRLSYQQLVDAGINAGVATKIRRWHSLPWTFGGDDSQLDNRSQNVRGLREGEREWVAASTGSDGSSGDPVTDDDWSPTSGADDATADAETDGGGTALTAESAWRERSTSEPVTTVPAVTEADAELLREAGITSVRRLATADPEQVADLLDIAYEDVASWHSTASTLDDGA